MILIITLQRFISFSKKIIIALTIIMLTFSSAFASWPGNKMNTPGKIGTVKQLDVKKNTNIKTGSVDTVRKAEISVSGIIIRIVITTVILGFLYIVLICSPYLPTFSSKMDLSSIVEHIDDKMVSGNKVLIGYVTRKGATASIAKMMHEVLTQKGHNADLRFIPNIEDDEDLSKYNSFILGSAVYWAMEKKFTDFLVKNRDLLSKKKTAIFAVCGTIQRETPKNFERVEAYYNSALKYAPEIQPFEKTAFAGSFDMEKLNFAERQYLNFLFTITPLKGGDQRDFDKITAWTEGISSSL